MRLLSRLGPFLGILVFVPALARAQNTVGVEVDEVTDNRVAAEMLRGSLDVRVKLKGGSVLEKAAAARVLVKEAKDNLGTNLFDASSSKPDFEPREYNNGTINFGLLSPPRNASSAKIKGVVELFSPGRDPASTVKVEKALAKQDAPLSSKALAAAKINLRLLSRQGYIDEMKKHKLDDAAIASIRAEGKKHGASDKEIEMAIGMAKALDSMDAEPAEGSVILAGKKADFDRIFRVEVLGDDGKPISTSGRELSTRGDDSVMTLHPSDKPPANASLQIQLLTEKSRVTSPFELTVPLP